MTVTPSGRRLGGRRSPPDGRDYPFGQHPRAMAMLASPVPFLVDPRASLPPAWDQGNGGTCAAHGGGIALQALVAPVVPFMPARLDLYAAGRAIDGTPLNQDIGCYTRSMLKALQRGTYDERWWPYDLANLALMPVAAERPFAIGTYEAIADADHLMVYLAAGGIAPFSIDLPGNFEDRGEGDGPDRGFVEDVPGDVSSMGEHCMAAIGYDKANGLALVRNSWGAAWGLGGHCWIPFTMILGSQRGGDCWAVHPAGNF